MLGGVYVCAQEEGVGVGGSLPWTGTCALSVSTYRALKQRKMGFVLRRALKMQTGSLSVLRLNKVNSC